MAESEQDGVLVRTAILRAGSELVLASIGMRIGGRYDVVGALPPTAWNWRTRSAANGAPGA